MTSSNHVISRRTALAGLMAAFAPGCAAALRTRPENPPDRDVPASALPDPWREVSVRWWSNVPSLARLDIVFASVDTDRRLVLELPNNRTVRRIVPRETDSLVVEFDGEDPVIGDVTLRLQGETDHELTLRFTDDLQVMVP